MSIIPCVPQITPFLIKAILGYIRFCYNIYRTSSVKYLVLYLKASQVLLQQYVGGQRICSTRPLKAAVSRTRSGCPRIIPFEHRLRIAKGDRSIIRVWMTLLGLFRILSFEGKVSFDTITSPGKMLTGDFIRSFQQFSHDFFHPRMFKHLTRKENGK
jgi:hypothetical protein